MIDQSAEYECLTDIVNGNQSGLYYYVIRYCENGEKECILIYSYSGAEGEYILSDSSAQTIYDWMQNNF